MALEYILGYKCKRCGYEWKPHGVTTKTEPVFCPGCHSAYWNRERRKQ